MIEKHEPLSQIPMKCALKCIQNKIKNTNEQLFPLIYEIS